MIRKIKIFSDSLIIVLLFWLGGLAGCSDSAGSSKENTANIVGFWFACEFGSSSDCMILDDDGYQFTTDGEIYDIDSDGSFIEFIKDGTIQFKDVDNFNQAGIDVAEGSWNFSEDKTQVTFNYFVSSVNLDDTQTCTINKLKINSLALILTSNWVGYQAGDKIYYEYY